MRKNRHQKHIPTEIKPVFKCKLWKVKRNLVNQDKQLTYSEINSLGERLREDDFLSSQNLEKIESCCYSVLKSFNYKNLILALPSDYILVCGIVNTKADTHEILKTVYFDPMKHGFCKDRYGNYAVHN